MAMKPAGKAIVIGLVAIGIAAGVFYSGALDKLKSSAPPIASTPATEVAPTASAPAATPVVEAPAPAQSAAPADAFDALIRQSGKK